MKRELQQEEVNAISFCSNADVQGFDITVCLVIPDVRRLLGQNRGGSKTSVSARYSG